MRTSVIVLSMVGLVGCGRLADVPGDSEPSADAGTSTGSGGGTSGSSTSTDTTPHDAGVTTKVDAGVKRSAGRCAKDADCPGGHCVELTVGGYRVCSYPPPAPEQCTNGPSPADECCGTCASGTCTLQTSCGGAFIMPHNVCAASDCTVNADCGANGVCLPTGVGSPYARTCMTSNECLHHSDCVAAPDGVCALVGTIGPLQQCAPWGCPGGSATQVANGLACIYGSDCSDDADCSATGHCEKVGGRPTCQPGVRSVCPPPP